MKTKRRSFLSILLISPFLDVFSGKTIARRKLLPLTPACEDSDEPTPAQTEGPYFKPNSPERSNLIDTGIRGTPLVITGQVVNTRCQPVARALLDWWHADDTGAYDNSGFRLRGHQYTDAQGNFRLETIVPGLYTGRTRHLHVKVQAPGKPVLTTQLYFPDEAHNQRDRIFKDALLMHMQKSGQKTAGKFTFVIQA